jgi:hypothetical protein
MLPFEKHYCSGSDPGKTVTEAFLRARLANGEIAPDAVRAARRDDLEALSAFVEESLAADDPETAELVLTYALECHPDWPERLGLLETVRKAERAAAVTAAPPGAVTGPRRGTR